MPPIPDDFWKAIGSGTAQVVLSLMLALTITSFVIVVRVMWKYIVRQHEKAEEKQKETNQDNDKRRDLALAQAGAYEKMADKVHDLERTVYERFPHVAR